MAWSVSRLYVIGTRRITIIATFRPGNRANMSPPITPQRINSILMGSNAVAKPTYITCRRSEEHTSELQSLMRISYAVFCLKKKKEYTIINKRHITTDQITRRDTQ